MTTPVVINQIRGASFREEYRVPGENFSTATFEVTSDPGIPVGDIAIEVILPDTVILTCESTSGFLTGSHDMILWAQWPDEREALIKAVVVVQPAPGDDPITSIIDGGAPGTEFEDETDGGEP